MKTLGKHVKLIYIVLKIRLTIYNGTWAHTMVMSYETANPNKNLPTRLIKYAAKNGANTNPTSRLCKLKIKAATKTV